MAKFLVLLLAMPVLIFGDTTDVDLSDSDVSPVYGYLSNLFNYLDLYGSQFLDLLSQIADDSTQTAPFRNEIQSSIQSLNQLSSKVERVLEHVLESLHSLYSEKRRNGDEVSQALERQYQLASSVEATNQKIAELLKFDSRLKEKIQDAEEKVNAVQRNYDDAVENGGTQEMIDARSKLNQERSDLGDLKDQSSETSHNLVLVQREREDLEDEWSGHDDAVRL